jgi:hypothetical protein
MIIDRFKELNLSEEEIKKECVIFNQIYTEYIRDDVKTKKNSIYIYQNPMDKTRKVVSNHIMKNLKKNDYTFNNNEYNTKYGHKEKVKQNNVYGRKCEYRRNR